MTITMSSDEVRSNWRTVLDRTLADHTVEIVIQHSQEPLATLVNHAAHEQMKQDYADLRERRAAEEKAGKLLTDSQWSALKAARAIRARNEPTVSSAELKARMLKKWGYAAS